MLRGICDSMFNTQGSIAVARLIERTRDCDGHREPRQRNGSTEMNQIPFSNRQTRLCNAWLPVSDKSTLMIVINQIIKSHMRHSSLPFCVFAISIRGFPNAMPTEGPICAFAGTVPQSEPATHVHSKFPLFKDAVRHLRRASLKTDQKTCSSCFLGQIEERNRCILVSLTSQGVDS
jgi:hypothetical protein